MQAGGYFTPYPLGQLMAYQRQITRYFSRHPVEAVFAYDNAARNNIAVNTQPFDCSQTEAYEEHLQGLDIKRCHVCMKVGHFAANCDEKKDDANQQARNYKPVETSTFRRNQVLNQNSGSPSRNFRGANEYTAKQHYQKPAQRSTSTNVCTYYNSPSMRCTRNPCGFPHACQTCNGGHPTHQCKQTRTAFKPF